MPIADHMNIQGYVTMQLQDSRQQLVETIRVKNKIVTDGRELVARQFAGENIAKVSHLAVGTGGLESADQPETVLTNNEELQDEVYRRPIDTTEVLPHEDGWKVVLTTTLPAGEANAALTEAGLFNGEDTAKMYNRVTFKPINKSENFTLTLKWEIIF